MAPRSIIILFLLGLIVAGCADAQRDGRRRTGRRKPTTESPPPSPETDVEDQADPKPEAEAEAPATVKSSEPESSATPSESKDSQNNAGPQFLAPRGTRKPRPIRGGGGGEGRPRPTLPAFFRSGGSGRTPRAPVDFQRTGSKSEDTPTFSTSTTARPARGSSRRRTNSAASAAAPAPAAPAAQANDNQDSSEAGAKKKRFGSGSTRRPSRGSRRTTPVADS